GHAVAVRAVPHRCGHPGVTGASALGLRAAVNPRHRAPRCLRRAPAMGETNRRRTLAGLRSASPALDLGRASWPRALGAEGPSAGGGGRSSIAQPRAAIAARRWRRRRPLRRRRRWQRTDTNGWWRRMEEGIGRRHNGLATIAADYKLAGRPWIFLESLKLWRVGAWTLAIRWGDDKMTLKVLVIISMQIGGCSSLVLFYRSP
ncbi:unnamed protein product, partial [Urochloa humidicola]